MTLQPNRRRVERIQLPEPINGMLGVLSVQILDIGLMGAKIQHDEPLDEGASSHLRFFWRGDEINVLARVTRGVTATGQYGEEIFQSGLEFLEASGDSGKVLRELITAHVTRLLEEQKANARGERDDSAVPFLRMSLDEDVSRRNPGIVSYVTYRLSEDGTWLESIAESPKQPEEGFTVLSSLGEQEVDLLKKSYEAADKNSRHLIRAIAEMSITEDAKSVPPQRLK